MAAVSTAGRLPAMTRSTLSISRRMAEVASATVKVSCISSWSVGAPAMRLEVTQGHSGLGVPLRATVCGWTRTSDRAWTNATSTH
jgi:hypothetical protein